MIFKKIKQEKLCKFIINLTLKICKYVVKYLQIQVYVIANMLFKTSMLHHLTIVKSHISETTIFFSRKKNVSSLIHVRNLLMR